MGIEELISIMTLEEKASLLCGESFFGSRELSQYGINRLQLLDGGTGMNFEQLFGDLYEDFTKENGFTRMELDNVTRYFYEEEKLTFNERRLRDKIYDLMKERIGGFKVTPGCYPPGISLASTWNRDVIFDVGRALGMEARLYGIECLLGTPNINLLRDPRNGRFFEGYSEDPYLTGELAPYLVKGVEGEGVASNVKHFAANNLEINRIEIDQHISKRALMELYLPAFKKCVEAGAATVMTSYPSINGVKCVEDKWLLRDILKGDWKFDGVNMTDWGACTGKTGDSAEAGIDLFMPGPWDYSDIIDAVNNGRLSEENLNDAVRRMINLTSKYSRKNQPFPYSEEEYLKFTSKAAYKAASEGIVMLKNNRVFPVSSDNFILFGDTDIRICGGGSAQVFTDKKTSMEDEFNGAPKDDYSAFQNNPDSIAVVVCSIDSKEGSDRISLEMDSKTKEILKKLISLKNVQVQNKIVLVLNTPGPVILDGFINDIDSIFAIYYPGSYGVKALKDIFYGKVNPSGKLTCSWPAKAEDMPTYLYYPDGYTSYYGEGIFVGYRGYEKLKRRPLFSFGFGLSYTKFEYSNIRTIKSEFSMGDEVEVLFTLKNIGRFDGQEVVQIYVGDPKSIKNKPVKELRAFGKYFVKAGESINCSLKFKIRDLASFDEDYDKFLVEDGNYDIYIGPYSSGAARALRIRVTDGDSEYRYGINTPIRMLMEIPELYTALKDEVRIKGFDEVKLLMTERYTPADSLSKIYENASDLTNFIAMCNFYKKS